MEVEDDFHIDGFLLTEDMGRLEQTIADGLQETQKSSNTPKKGNFACPNCSKVYKIEKYFLKHVRKHTLEVIMMKAPSREEFQEFFFESCKPVVVAMKNEESFGDIAERLRLFCLEVEYDCIKWKDFVSLIFEEFHKIWKSHGDKIIFPSELRHVFLIASNRHLNNYVFMNKIKESLSKHHETTADISQVFIGNLLLSLSQNVFAYLMKKLRGEVVTSGSVSQVPVQDQESEGFRQILFHVSGFIVKQHLKLSFRYSKDVKWQEYGKAMWSCFIEGDFVVSADNNDKVWTEAINRGGLTLVGEKAMSFFIPLVKLVLSSEGVDGSFHIDMINAKVFNSLEILSLWDDLICNVLSKELKGPLLLSVTKSLINTCANGVIKRRLNAELAKGTTNVSFRPKLAPRQIAS